MHTKIPAFPLPDRRTGLSVDKQGCALSAKGGRSRQ